MNAKKLDDHLTDYYVAQSPATATLDALVSSAPVVAIVDASGGSTSIRQRSHRFSLALAACLAAAICGSSYVSYRIGFVRGGLVVDTLLPESAPQLARSANAVVSPKLVAVKFFAEWCGRCPQIAPIYTELIEEHRNEPILFVTFDVTDESTTRAAKKLASTLGIKWNWDAVTETGAVVLIDREAQQVLATLTAKEHVPIMEDAIARALPRREP